MEENRTRSSAAGEKRRTWGFTLVELIVVIAILAVLAGVAYPVYTGYITKANEAADLALLGQVNESFTSALYDVGYNDGLPETAEATLTEKKLSKVSSDGIDGLNEAFMKYFAGNENTEFKVYTGLGYDTALGGFYGKLPDGTMVTAGGKKIKIEKNSDGTSTYTFEADDGRKWSYTVKDEDLETYKEVIGQNIGVDELMSAMDTCGVAAQASFSSVLGSKMQRTMTLGADANAAFEKYLNDNGIPDDPTDARYQKAISNAVIMSVADWTKGKTADDIIAIVNGSQHMGTGLAMAIGDAATAFGVLTVWAQDPVYKDRVLEGMSSNGKTAAEYWKQLSDKLASGDKDQINEAKLDIAKLTSQISGTSFSEYASSESGRKAIEGYIAALRTLDSNNATLKDANGNNIYGNGFADEDLVDMLKAVFG